MGALTLAIPAEQRGRRLRLLLAYNLGRILSYACAGLLLGLAGWAVARTRWPARCGWSPGCC